VHRYFITGTDTDVGKTRVTAALALALQRAGHTPTIVKLVQTGAIPGAQGDAQLAGRLSGVPSRELARYEKAADPWSAALAAGALVPTAQELADALAQIGGALVAEGAGGIMAPLSAGAHLGHVAVLARLETVVTIGLRLGCLNHALLTLDHCRRLSLPVACAVLVERWGPTQSAYRADVARVLRPHVRMLGLLPFSPEQAESVEAGAKLFESLVKHER
jgi:dethiobiotin synthase